MTMGSRIAFLALGAASVALAAAPKGYFRILGDGTVQDTRTGLLWQQKAQHGTQGYQWSEAADYCAALTLGGIPSGWRVPTKIELETLVDVRRFDPAPMIDETAFPETPAALFWTSSLVGTDVNWAWAVSFSFGYSSYHKPLDAASAFWVRCVH